jgi:NAD-dependent deacetylase
LSVYPAAGLIEYVPATSPIYVIDPGTPDLWNIAGHVEHIKKGASEGMKELYSLLNKETIAVDGAQTTENSSSIKNIS